MTDTTGTYSRSGAIRVQPVEDLLTDHGNGPNRRLRVDVGQTGFFAGREFRTFFEFTANDVIKVVVPVNVILFGLGVTLTAGQMRLETVVGGTEGGSFSNVLPIFGRNNMTERPLPLYTPVVTMASGGTHTGGTVLDVLLNKVADNAVFASSVGATEGDERGVGAGTYYFRITVTGTTAGVLKARWEERP